MADIRKVTEPNRKVTDEYLIRELERQGIDKDFVEFWHDYAPRSKGNEYSPYGKFYRDLKSAKRFMVASGLPMVKSLGHKIEAGWLYAKGKYYSRANLFSAIVEGNRVQVTCLSDQPDGRKLNDRVTWRPQLFLNGMEQNCGEAALLETDPTNGNYHRNVLEWDYGVCKRRLRIIEGRVRERWVFSGDPKGEVRIKHNQAGDYQLKFGRFKINDDEELVPAEAFVLPNDYFLERQYPLELGASDTFYPDASPETSSVDGICYPWEETCEDITWALIRDYTATLSDDAGDSLAIQIHCCPAPWTDKYKSVIRSPVLLDISSLPPSTILSATFSLYGYSKFDNLGIAHTINIFSSNPQSNTAIVPTDYALARWGSTAFSTAITHDDFNIGDPGTVNDFVVNAAGITFLQAAADGDGIVKLGLREASYDAPNSAPVWASNLGSKIYPWAADKGVGYKPTLVITYEIPIPSGQGDATKLLVAQGVI